MPKKTDQIFDRIEAFNRVKGGGVIIQRAAKGYSLFREDYGKPIVRPRPTGKGDQVEVMWGSHRDKWEQIGDFGPMLIAPAWQYASTFNSVNKAKRKKQSAVLGSGRSQWKRFFRI